MTTLALGSPRFLFCCFRFVETAEGVEAALEVEEEIEEVSFVELDVEEGVEWSTAGELIADEERERGTDAAGDAVVNREAWIDNRRQNQSKTYPFLCERTT